MQYHREESVRRAKYGRNPRGIWVELARISGLTLYRIKDLRRDAAYKPRPAEITALAIATGILPESRWHEPDPGVFTGKLIGET